MIIWKNKGFLVFLAIALGMVLYGFLTTSLGIADQKDFGSTIGRLFLGLIPAALNEIFNRIFLKNEADRTLYDEKGQGYAVNNYSTFFFIRNIHWTYLLAALGILLAVFN